MSDEELRTALSSIMLSQAVILRITRGLTTKNYEKTILDYAQDLEDFSKALMSVLEVKDDTTA